MALPGASRLIWNIATWASGTTPSASSAATGYPADNAQINIRRTQRWRSSTGTGNQDYTLTFAVATTIQAVVLVDYRVHSGGGTVKAEYWTGAAFAAFDGGTGLFTIPTYNPTGCVALYFAAGRSTTKIKVTFTNTGGVNEYVYLGELVAGPYTQCATGIAQGSTILPKDPSTAIYAEGGQKQTWTRSHYHDQSTVWAGLSATDRDVLHDQVFPAVGTGTPVVYAVDSNSPSRTYYGYLGNQMPARHVKGDRWDVTIPFEEAR